MSCSRAFFNSGITVFDAIQTGAMFLTHPCKDCELCIPMKELYADVERGDEL